MQMTLRQHIQAKVEVGIAAILSFQRAKAHEVMDLMLDPRCCLGQTFQLVHEDIAHAKALWKRYTDEVLVPSAVTLARAIREQQSVNQQSTTNNRLADSDDENWANTDTMGLCDDSCNNVDVEPIDDFELKFKV